MHIVHKNIMILSIDKDDKRSIAHFETFVGTETRKKEKF